MSEGYTQQPNVSEKLRALGIIVEEPVLYPEFHTPLQLQVFGEMSPAAVRFFDITARACVAFIEGPLLRDSFGNDHTKRREWRATLDDATYRFYDDNKLRLNVIGRTYQALYISMAQLDTQRIHTEQAEEVRQLVHEIPIDEIREYSTLSDEVKIEIVTKLDAVCKRFLTIVTQGR